MIKGPIFMAKLVDIASKAKGNVEDVKLLWQEENRRIRLFS